MVAAKAFYREVATLKPGWRNVVPRAGSLAITFIIADRGHEPRENVQQTYSK
jgi:hypothetical protein